MHFLISGVKSQAMPGSEFKHDVTVIGAGWSGLLACKHMLEEGLTVVVLERRATIGGVWQYSDDPNETSVMRSTQCTSSATVTEMSDFPMPDEFGDFPSHLQITQYLDSYSNRFNLWPHIRLDTKVDQVKKDENVWRAHTIDGQIYTSRYLVVCTGIYEKANLELQTTLFSNYTGSLYHSKEIKYPLARHNGDDVLIVGGGETASDIVSEWYEHTNCIYWSIPRGQHFFRKYAKVLPWKKPQALDKASSRALRTIAPYHRSKPGLSWICKWTTNGSLLAYQGHGIPEWRNDSPFFHFVINKNGKVLDLIDYKKVVPKGAIKMCEGKSIQFSDGTSKEFDVIIMCTGYDSSYFPFLPEKYHKNITIRDRYKFIFDVEDPSIAFVGYVRPVIGSIAAVSEMQSRWVAKVFAQTIPIKPLEQRQADTKQDAQFWENYFKESSQRLVGLVEGLLYGEEIARMAGLYPDYSALLFRNPKGWLTAIFAPFSSSTYRLNEPEHEAQAIRTMAKHQKNTTNSLHLLWIIFMRFSGIDSTIVLLERVKYSIQTSWWWPHIRDLRIVRALNWVWCLPKRYLFDCKSEA